MMIRTFVFHWAWYLHRSAAIYAQKATSDMIFRKVTRMNLRSFAQTNTGEINNVMNSDVDHFDVVSKNFNFLMFTGKVVGCHIT